jgi:hypothetical protein
MRSVGIAVGTHDDGRQLGFDEGLADDTDGHDVGFEDDGQDDG